MAAHGVQELRSTSGFYKTQVRLWVEGCRDWHVSLRSIRASFLIHAILQLCKFWLAGHCPAGALCRHAHGDEEWPSELQAR